MKLLSALTLGHIITGVLSFDFKCYYCQNYDQDSQWHYDEDCGADVYQGNIDECHDCNNCYVAIHEGEGGVLRVDRGGTSGHSDGDCTKSTCYCEGELCNNDLCGYCTTTTAQPTPTVTPPSLECFYCQNSDPSLDNYDPTCNSPYYQGNTFKCLSCNSCYMKVLEDTSVVVRGAMNGVFQDGQCLYGTIDELGMDYTECYCTSDLCNTSLCEECDLFKGNRNQTYEH
ncbi:unnamed protein product [Meganyctiphanes norvegica]|uniref:Uncharacterized protein n=1 Tax=Meganyctiphanes norvegica TaxID=48144 RepID=A0AAV2QBW8_MEGNR